jgi:OTU domain-containing protein 3
LELSAFAHMAHRDVKVIQPGLVYVIEWASGWDSERDDEPTSAAASAASSSSAVPMDGKSKRAMRRERKRSGMSVTEDQLEEPDGEDEHVGPVYVA